MFSNNNIIKTRKKSTENENILKFIARMKNSDVFQLFPVDSSRFRSSCCPFFRKNGKQKGKREKEKKGLSMGKTSTFSTLNKILLCLEKRTRFPFCFQLPAFASFHSNLVFTDLYSEKQVSEQKADPEKINQILQENMTTPGLNFKTKDKRD